MFSEALAINSLTTTKYQCTNSQHPETIQSQAAGQLDQPRLESVFFAGLATMIPLATPPGLQFALAMCHSLPLETAVGFLRQEFHDLTSDIIIVGLHSFTHISNG